MNAQLPTLRRRILVVDDDATMRFFVQQLLAEEFEVVAAADGRTALAHLRGGAWVDAVVADLGMPGLDGAQLAAALRADAGLARLPMLVLSGAESSADRVRCLEAGADDFVTKPFHPAELRARLRGLLRRAA